MVDRPTQVHAIHLHLSQIDRAVVAISDDVGITAKHLCRPHPLLRAKTAAAVSGHPNGNTLSRDRYRLPGRVGDLRGRVAMPLGTRAASVDDPAHVHVTVQIRRDRWLSSTVSRQHDRGSETQHAGATARISNSGRRQTATDTERRECTQDSQPGQSPREICHSTPTTQERPDPRRHLIIQENQDPRQTGGATISRGGKSLPSTIRCSSVRANAPQCEDRRASRCPKPERRLGRCMRIQWPTRSVEGGHIVDHLPNANRAERNQRRKRAFIPVWPVVASIVLVVLLVVLVR